MLAPTPERLAELDTADLGRVATFFDIDGTKCTKPLTIELLLRIGVEMHDWAAKIAPIREELTRYHDERTYDYTPVVDTAIDLLRSGFLKGLRECDVMDIATRMMVDMRSQRYLFTKTLTQTLAALPRSERGLMVAITGSPQRVAEMFLDDMGFDLVYGLGYHVEDGYYNGKLDERSANEKGKIVEEVAGRFRIKLEDSMAIGDTASDIPMLNCVGFPIAMNPNAELLAHARKKVVPVVYDRQKCGVTIFRPDKYGRLTEVAVQRILPAYVKDFPGCLPDRQSHF